MDPMATRMAGKSRVAGTHIGPFVLDRFLGGGADTEVWRADGDGILVALKLVRDSGNPVAIARLAHEALALDLVQHPHVVHRFDADTTDGEAWLATALHDAGTLAHRLDDGLLTVPEAAAALAPIADALATAHELGIVHRDINPANVLLAADGPVLLDFGHAAIGGHTRDGWTATGAVAVARTEGFAPSEREITGAVDIYALGVTLLEAVTGVRTLDELNTRRQREAAVPIADLVAACCALDPRQRPSATLVGDALRALAGDTRPPTQPAPTVIDLVRAEQLEARAATGRTAELERLAAAAQSATTAGELGAILVVAPPGSGKSWLLETALASAHDDGYATRRARCTETVGDLRVLRPIVEPDLDDERLGVANAAVLRAAIGSGSGVRDATPRDVADALAALLRLRPAVVMVDDLHWATAELVELLSLLAFRSGVPGALFLGTRPGYLDPDDLDVETLALGPLDDEALRAAVLDLAGEEHADAAVALAAGNPLHAREAALALAAGITLGTATDLRSVIDARLASADAYLAPALALAAASGDGFWPEAIGDELLDQVPRLVRSGYARPRLRSSLSGTTEFEWAHPLLREVAYERLTELDRRVLHGRLARRFDARDDVGAETIARHAGIAFRLGEESIAPVTARHAAASVRDALDHYAVPRAAEWVELLRETEREADLADVLDADVKNRQGDFTGALHLLLPHIDRTDDIGTRALTVGTESLVGTGDYERAVEWGTTARDRLDDRPLERALNARGLAVALRERGELEAALEELDTAAELADRAGDLVLATRTYCEATTVAALVNQQSPGVVDSVRRARDLLSRIETTKDSRALTMLATSSAADSIALEDPEAAFEMQFRAFESASTSADAAALARAARRLIDVAWDAERPAIVAEMSQYLRDAPVSGEERVTFRLIATLARASLRPPDRSLGDLLTDCVRSLDTFAETAKTDQHMALCAYAYSGRLTDLQRRYFEFDAVRRIPALFRVLADLNLAILRGPPHAEPEGLPAETTAFHNERALLSYLGGHQERGDAFMRERRAFLQSSGSTHQVYTVTFAGALFSALGPPDCEPRSEWVRGHIFDSPFPGIWTFQRALVAMLLAERGGTDAADLAHAARRLRASISPDPQVSAWFGPRLDRLS